MQRNGLRRVPLSGADPAGVLYTDGQRYVRRVGKQVHELLGSGFIDELTARGLFPATRILDSEMVEHEAIEPLTYPREWSFGMVKAAALVFLDVAEAAWRRGYTLQDAHLFNFVFRGAQPVWVDIGSFVPQAQASAPLPWLAQFHAGVLAPLCMWADGAPYLARAAIRHPAAALPVEEFIAYRHPWLRGGPAWLGRLRQILGWRPGAASITEDSPRARLFRALFARKAPAVFERLRRAVIPLRAAAPSAWGAYQDEYDGGLPERFRRIVQIVDTHQSRSLVELGGNAGVLSRALAEGHPERRVLCTDYEAAAVDRLFARMQAGGPPNLAAAVLDFMVPEYTPAETPPAERFRGDCVLALALTHHLLLSQGYDYDQVLARIREYTTGLALVEFMPLGLHDGRSAPPVPAWYGEEAFAAAFARYFTPMGREQLDANRILLVGRAL
jgi:hypothetical protein